MDTSVSFLGMLPVVATPSAHGHFSVLPSFERCSQQQPYPPMDIHLLPPFLKLLPATPVSALGHFDALPSLRMST
jgi:hypothetical protein